MAFICGAARSRGQGPCQLPVLRSGVRCRWHVGASSSVFLEEPSSTAAFSDLGGLGAIEPGDERIAANGPQWAASEMLALTDTPADVAAGRAFHANVLTFQQVEIIELLLAHRRVAVRGAHSLGKSILLSFLIWWWLVRRQNNMVLVLSAKADQSAHTLFPEAVTHWEHCYGPRPPRSSARTLYVDRVKYPYWRSTIISGSKGESISSYHPRAPGSVLLLVDEASAISEELAASIEGLMSNDQSYCLACGNALNTSLQAPFRRFFSDSRWYPYHLKTRDHPNFLAHERGQRLPYPTAISPSWYYSFRDAVGEDDPEFQSRCEGNFPESEGVETLRRVFDTESISKASGLTLEQLNGLKRVVDDDGPERLFSDDFEQMGVWSEPGL